MCGATKVVEFVLKWWSWKVLTFYAAGNIHNASKKQLEWFNHFCFIIGPVSFKDVIDFQVHVFRNCDSHETILVMPATIATSERTFSSLRRVKIYLSSTMTKKDWTIWWSFNLSRRTGHFCYGQRLCVSKRWTGIHFFDAFENCWKRESVY